MKLYEVKSSPIKHSC